MAQFTGGEGLQKRVDELDFGSHAGDLRFDGRQVVEVAGAAHHADFGNSSYEVRAEAPGGQVAEGVTADQEEAFRVRLLPGEQAHCVNRVVRTGAVNFETRKFKGRVMADHRLKHGQAVNQRGNGGIEFMGRVWGERPEQAGEFELGDRFTCKDKMTDMRRVEGAAEYADSCLGHAGSISQSFLGRTCPGGILFETGYEMSDVTIISSTSPLKRLMHALRAIEAGEYTSILLVDLLKESGDLGQLARMLDSMAHEISLRDHQLHLLRKVIPIGVSLSAEKDFNRLLETLVVEAQSVTNADAGTLYLLEEDVLKFVILRNTSLDLVMGGTSGKPITLNPVRLRQEDGSENRSNVASFAALTRKRINIADAYTTDGFDFSGTKTFDQQTRYRSKSFLTIPLENQSGKLIGVLQLINAKDPKTNEIIPFIDYDVLEMLILLATAALDGYIREAYLRQEIAKLKIEIDETRRARQVAEITESKYFRDLKTKAKEMRDRDGK